MVKSQKEVGAEARMEEDDTVIKMWKGPATWSIAVQKGGRRGDKACLINLVIAEIFHSVQKTTMRIDVATSSSRVMVETTQPLRKPPFGSVHKKSTIRS